MLVWRWVRQGWRQVVQQRLQAVGGYISTDGVFFSLIVVWCWLVTRRCVCGGGGGKGVFQLFLATFVFVIAMCIFFIAFYILLCQLPSSLGDRRRDNPSKWGFLFYKYRECGNNKVCLCPCILNQNIFLFSSENVVIYIQ